MPHGGGRQKALGEKGDEIVRGAVKREPQATRQDLANNIATEYGTRVSPTAVARALARLGITRNKLTIRAEDGKKHEVHKKTATAQKNAKEACSEASCISR